MKKMIMLLVLALPMISFSQSAIADRFAQKVKARAEQRLDQGMDKAIDKAEEELTKKPKERNVSENKTEEKPAGKEVAAKDSQPANLQSYSRYDFVPGQNIVYAEDFGQDVIGEFPLKWNTNGRGEAVTLQGLAGQWMRMYHGSRFVSPAVKKLPENFTMEFDLVLQFNPGDDNYAFPDLNIRLLGLAATDVKGNDYLSSFNPANEAYITLSPGQEGSSNISMGSDINGSRYFVAPAKGLQKLDSYYGKPVHVALWVQKERLRCWINGEKLFDMPKAVSEEATFDHLGFDIPNSAYEAEKVGMFVSNIVIAEGTADLRSKLITEGKWATSGILFDVASDKIKPESYGVLKEIATVLKDNATVKVKIIGHTDSDGEDAKNLDLSKRRAASVKAFLQQEFKIDAGRMETDGLGETKPVAPNNTKEGKLQNRRVEFVKLP